MAKKIDFVYMAGNCPSDGCPEYFFNHQSSFDNKHARKAFSKAMRTIERYSLSRTQIPDASPLRTEKQISDFAESIQESVSDCFDITTIFACKYGKILYQKSIRFPNIEDTEDLVKKIREALPINLEKERKRTIESYLMDVK